ncbi:MAG TPA: imidazolonepropionase [Dokdonella sp.]
MSAAWDGLLLDCRLATMAGGDDAYGTVERGALGWKDGRIAYVGAQADLPGAPDALAREVGSAGGALVTPGLIDCHTHLVFGGDRADEFEQRLEGASYEDIARAGGGILSTVRATRAADEDALVAAALPRARALRDDGVTTVEIKSGYALEREGELRMLRVARRVGAELGIGVVTTLLAAHALPPEYAGRPDDYVDLVVAEILPAAAREGLADMVDAFCERIAFDPAQTRRVLGAARALGLPVKLHADQLSDLGGAALAAAAGALSAEHLEHTSEAGVRAMAAAGTVAVLLPGAFYAMRETRTPPIAALREHRVPIAVASDMNPGTSPLRSLRLALNMACIQLRLTPAEALRGATVNAARALGRADRGRLAEGLRADFVVWNATRPVELCYWIGGGLARSIYVGGRIAESTDAG